MIPRFSRRLNRESTERLGLDFRDHRIDVDSADGSTERALKDELPNLPAYRVDLDSADGSTERALKDELPNLPAYRVDLDSADGSTERALKGSYRLGLESRPRDSADGSTERALKV